MDLLGSAFIYLMAAVIAVPLANRLGLGSVLGYLLAGIVIGPALGLVGAETAEVQHFAEFGVVMMLFLVGLELQPAMLWRMRNQLIGLGGIQVVGTTAAIAGVGWVLGLNWQTAVAVGMILSLSSTAIVLQTLNEKGWMKSSGGQSSFSVLLTQDIAVIPMLALLPLLALSGGTGLEEVAAAGGHGAESHGDGGHHGGGALHALPGWAQGLVTIGVIVGIVIAGRFLMRPVFRFIAEARLREIFTAAALLLVIGIALLMTAIGLSPALGTFLAGVVLSDNEYRHELESDIEPFKGLLLGLFFLTVGAGVDFGLLMAEPLVIVGLAIGLLLIKGAVLFCLAIAFGIKGADRWLFALGMAQAGEFAFVLFGFSLGAGVMGPELIGPLTLIVALSMLMTPLLFILHERVLAPRAIKGAEREPDPVTEPSTVVMAGMGRFGQVVGRLLVSNGYRVVVLDQDPGTIETLNKVGLKTYYGDASRPDLLHSAGLHDADLFVAAGDDREKTNLMVEHVAKTYPHVRILARAHDRHHVYDLEKHGAHIVEREAFEGALSLGKAALRELGMHPFRAETQTRAFRRHDLRSLDALRARYNAGGMDGEYIDAAKALSDELMKVMQSDRSDQHDRSERGWTPPPKGDATL